MTQMRTLIRRSSLLLAATGILTAVACGAEPTETVGIDGGQGAGTAAGTGTATGSGTATGGLGSGLGVGTSTGTATGSALPEPECTTDANGVEKCVCIKIATWGALGAFGAVPGMDGQDAIAAWLNDNSTGTADYFAEKPVINADTLAGYNVILIQDVSLWPAFTPEEATAFDGWVRSGGGVISLNGYKSDPNEMANVNGLLAFSGLSYNAASDTVGEGYTGDSCQPCYGSSAPMGGWNAMHPIAENISDVGAFHGRSITAGAGSEIVASTAEGTLGATMQVDAGRVFMFHDEWVTYNSQWTGAGLPTSCLYNDPGHECNNKSPANDYSSAQFWYNSILWASSNPECFTIDDVTIVK